MGIRKGYFKVRRKRNFGLNVDSEARTTKTSDFAKRRTITPTSLVKVIPLKRQKVCQTKITNIALMCKYSKQIQFTRVVSLFCKIEKLLQKYTVNLNI